VQGRRWSGAFIQSSESLGSKQGRRREDHSRRRPISLGVRQVRAGAGHDRHRHPEQNLSAIYLMRPARVRSFSGERATSTTNPGLARLGGTSPFVETDRGELLPWTWDDTGGVGVAQDAARSIFFFWLGGSRSPSPRERRGARATANDQADSRAPTRSVVVCIVGRRPTGNEACEHRSRETAPRPYPIAVDSRHPLASSRRARPVQSCFSFRERFGNGCTAHGRAGPRSIGCAVATAPFLPP
jgi:hypothetical protein